MVSTLDSPVCTGYCINKYIIAPERTLLRTSVCYRNVVDTGRGGGGSEEAFHLCPSRFALNTVKWAAYFSVEGPDDTIGRLDEKRGVHLNLY